MSTTQGVSTDPGATEFQVERKRLKRFTWICAIGSLATGVVVWRLIRIPFGLIFNHILVAFTCLLALALLGWGIQGLRKQGWWWKLAGLVPVVLSVSVAVLTIVVLTDMRILYYRGPAPDLTREQWQADFHGLVDLLAEKHVNLPALIDRTVLDGAVAAVNERMDQLTDGDKLMELLRIVSLPGDAHTFPFVVLPAYDLHSLPLQVFGFSDGWGIVAAGRECRELVGCRILAIAGKPIEEIFDGCDVLLAAESDMGRKERFSYMCVMAEWLAYHDVISDLDQVTLTLLDPAGNRVERTLEFGDYYRQFLWSNFFRIDNDLPMVYGAPRKDNYRYELRDNGQTLFIQFNQCENQDGRPTLDQMVAEIRTATADSPLERCIVDIRHNDGGNRIWGGLVDFLKTDSRINQPGRLLVLIGRRTFSSAVMFANQLQMNTHAVFLGEPTGQGPIFFAGPRQYELPHSRLPFFISSHRTEAGLPFDRRDCLVPDVRVAMSLADFRSGTDPVMAAVMASPVPEPSAGVGLTENEYEYVGRYLLSPVQALDVTVADGCLYVSLDDFLPASYFRFSSRLTPTDDPGVYATRIPGMTVRLDPEIAVIDWQAVSTAFNRAPHGTVLAGELFREDDIRGGVAAIRASRSDYVDNIANLENTLNAMGYDLMGKERLDDALLVFKLNTELYPQSFNVFDSYGEGLLAAGDREGAIENYRRSLALNPDSQSGKAALEKLGVEI